MATFIDNLNPPPSPQRVFYSTGRMLGVEDFQADQDYHRARLARVLMQLCGSGTVAGLLVKTNGNSNLQQLEVQVTPGTAIDRVGRLIEVPRQVCIGLHNWLTQQVQAWQDQINHPVPGQAALANPNTAIHDGSHLMVDVFASFVPCTRGLTPCLAAEDDYDATDAFSANRWLDSFAMQLVLRTDTTPLTPADPWKSAGTLAGAGDALNAPTLSDIQNLLLAATAGPTAAPAEYPPHFDASSVFLARLLIAATPGTGNNGPTWDLANISIDNNSRLFVYPLPLVARLTGLASGTET